MKDFDREIEVIENIIKILRKCLTVHVNERQTIQVANCINDIRLCRKELKQLIEERANAEKEQAGDAAI
jgi:hypothetical protein